VQKKVLVTGANGFLGNNIVRNLLKNNYSVYALVRLNSNASILKNLDCKIVRSSLGNEIEMDELFANCNFVIHCASKTDQNETNFNEYIKANITSTKKIIFLCKKHKTERLIFISSANCFTNGSKENPGNENSGFMEFLKNSNYAYSKFLAQKLVLKEVRGNNLKAIILAPTFLLGAYDTKPSSGALTNYILTNKILFYPKGGKSFVDVNAITSAVVNALYKGRMGESYLLSGVNMSYKEYFRRVAELSNQKKVIIPIPEVLVNLFSLLLIFLPFKKTLLLKANLTSFFQESYFDNSKAKIELNMPDTIIDDSIIKTIEWLKNGLILAQQRKNERNEI